MLHHKLYQPIYKHSENSENFLRHKHVSNHSMFYQYMYKKISFQQVRRRRRRRRSMLQFSNLWRNPECRYRAIMKRIIHETSESYANFRKNHASVSIKTMANHLQNHTHIFTENILPIHLQNHASICRYTMAIHLQNHSTEKNPCTFSGKTMHRSFSRKTMAILLQNHSSEKPPANSLANSCIRLKQKPWQIHLQNHAYISSNDRIDSQVLRPCMHLEQRPWQIHLPKPRTRTRHHDSGATNLFRLTAAEKTRKKGKRSGEGERPWQ